jgi:hypothetical protein
MNRLKLARGLRVDKDEALSELRAFVSSDVPGNAGLP